MSNLDLLARLVARCYGADQVRLHPLHQFEVAARGVYRVEQAAGLPWLLRACRREAETDAWLAERGTMLFFCRGVPRRPMAGRSATRRMV